MTAPAARLLAAADLLDKRASEATEGPWFNTRDGEVKNAKNWDVVDRMGAGSKDATYIALMDPEKGKLLAKVLRAEAKRLKRTELMLAFGGAPLFKPEPDTLALADLLLAGGS